MNPNTFSHQAATDIRCASAMGSAATWMANGSPAASNPDGIDIAGNPVNVHGLLKILEPVVASPLGAVVEATGMIAASTEDSIALIFS